MPERTGTPRTGISTKGLEQDLHNRLPKAPDLIYCKARGHWPAPSTAQLTALLQPLEANRRFFCNRSLKKGFNGKIHHRTAPSSDVTLRSDDRFSPHVAVTAQTCAVTATKITRIAPFGDFLGAFSIVKIGLLQLT